MSNQSGRRFFALGLLLALLILLTMVATAGLSGHRFVIGGGGGPVSQDGLTMQSAFGLPVVGGAQSGLKLCSGFHALDCSTGQSIYLPLAIRPGA
ncbi:MAG: hypothetical protein PVJ75_10315 [Chloroflexota bacterium]